MSRGLAILGGIGLVCLVGAVWCLLSYPIPHQKHGLPVFAKKQNCEVFAIVEAHEIYLFDVFPIHVPQRFSWKCDDGLTYVD